MYDLMNDEYSTKIEEIEAKRRDIVEQNANLALDKEILSKEVACLNKRVAHLEEVNQKLKKDNEELLKIVKEIEGDNKKNFEEKAVGFQAAYGELECKLKVVDEENKLLKQENSRLKQEVVRLENVRNESNKERNELINHYKDHIANLKKSIDTLNQEKTALYNEANKENIRLSNMMNQNSLNPASTSNMRSSMSIGYAEDDFGLKFLELESKDIKAQLKGQIIQKNKIINELNAKVIDLVKQNSSLEEKVNECENQIVSLKSRTPSVAEEPEFFDSYMVKKRKIDEYDYVKKKIKDTPAKEDLKKEIKYLENKTKNYERQLQRKRLQEEEYATRIQDIMKKNMELEYKINFEMSS